MVFVHCCCCCIAVCVVQQLERGDFFSGFITKSRLFPSIHDAVLHCLNHTGKGLPSYECILVRFPLHTHTQANKKHTQQAPHTHRHTHIHKFSKHSLPQTHSHSVILLPSICNDKASHPLLFAMCCHGNRRWPVLLICDQQRSDWTLPPSGLPPSSRPSLLSHHPTLAPECSS